MEISPTATRRRDATFALLIAAVGALSLIACNRSNEPQRIDVAVTADGFVPKQTEVKVGRPVTLVVTRKVEPSCATEVVVKDYGINQPLPKDQPVEVTFTPTKPGKIRMACAMDMVAGELVAE